jgi:hypothetical protein
MIKPVPAAFVESYLRIMAVSLVVNTIINLLLYGSVLSPIYLFILILITDRLWWFQFKRLYR